MDAQELWSRVCELLREELSNVVYTTFIEKTLEPISLADNVLTMLLTSEPLRMAMTNRYIPIIERNLRTMTGQRIQVRMLNADELARETVKDHTEAKPVNPEETPLNPRYTFESFVVGNSNRLAYACALAVAEAPAETFNPLFIHGSVGLGKTHLMHAIGQYVHEHYPEKKLLYTTSETFVNELVTAIEKRTTAEFRQRYRSPDVLMVDDIQFIAKRDFAQEEFFNTFNALYLAGKQIVLTSDKPAQSIPRLQERLVGRFACGVSPCILGADFETRLAILRKKAARDGQDIDDDVLSFIAENVNSNVRELEGCLNRLKAMATLNFRPITLELAKDALAEVLENHQQHAITADFIIRTVAAYYNMKPEDITGPSRRHEIVVPRQIAIYLTREMTQLSLPQIGDSFGNRDHSTVLYSTKLVERALKESPEMVRAVSDLRQRVQES